MTDMLSKARSGRAAALEFLAAARGRSGTTRVESASDGPCVISFRSRRMSALPL